MEISNIKLIANITELGKRFDLVADVEGKARSFQLSLQESSMASTLTESELYLFAAKKLLSHTEFKKHTAKVSEPVEMIVEEKMTEPEKTKREEVVKALKKKIGDFKERYGKRAEDVMYATATKKAINEVWKRTGKTQKDPASGKVVFEYAEIKSGKFTGKTVFKDQYGKIPVKKAWISGAIGEEVGSFQKNIGVNDVTSQKPNDQTAWNVPFKHTVYIEPQMKTGVFFGYTLDENGNKIQRIFDNMTQVHEWAKSLNADVQTVSDNVPQIAPEVGASGGGNY